MTDWRDQQREERNERADSIGALWRRESRNGAEYLTGEVTIDGKLTRIVCFRAKSEHPKAPHWRILISRPREERGPAEAHGESAAFYDRPEQRDHPNPPKKDEPFQATDDDVPF